MKDLELAHSSGPHEQSLGLNTDRTGRQMTPVVNGVLKYHDPTYPLCAMYAHTLGDILSGQSSFTAGQGFADGSAGVTQENEA